MVKIICGACSKPLSIDETKLPMKEVSFPCPLCKTKLKVDRRQINAESSELHRAEVAEGAAPAAAPAVVSSPAIEPEISPAAAGASLPVSQGAKAVIVGQNLPELQDAARKLAGHIVHRPTIPEGRDYYLQEFPEVVFIAPEALSQPPMDDLVPLTSVGPVERRRGFFILVGDNLRTLDGNAAFLYGVNLVVTRKDLGSIARIYQDARRDHDRLARGFTQFADE